MLGTCGCSGRGEPGGRDWTPMGLAPYRGGERTQRGATPIRPDDEAQVRSHGCGLALGCRRTSGRRRAPSRREARRSPVRAPRRATRRSRASSDTRRARCRRGCSDSRLRARLGLRAQGRPRRGPAWRRAQAATSIPAGARRGDRLGAAATAVGCPRTRPAPTAESRSRWSHLARGQGSGAVRTCPVCGSPLVGKRTDALYCGPPCRAEASLVRRLYDGRQVDGYRDRRRIQRPPEAHRTSGRAPPPVDVT